MCGILYSQDSTGFSNLDMLKRRGPEGFTELENDLGYFAHSMLNTIGESTPQPYHTKSGILLYNGSTYNSGKANDTQWLGEKLDDNLDNTLNVVRELNGEYALIYVTEKNIVFCVDHFEQRNLWFYYKQLSKDIAIASVPNVVTQKYNAVWRVQENKIYVINRDDFTLSIHTNKEWNLEQTTKDFDKVFEEFEKAVMCRYIPGVSVNLLSSGVDSGVINCASHKIFKQIDCVSDPRFEDKETLKQRMLLHKSTLITCPTGDQPEKIEMFEKIYPNDDLWDLPCVDPLITIVRKYMKSKRKKIMLFGQGGDELYNDYHGQCCKFGRTSGRWPDALEMVWPWHSYKDRLSLNNMRPDFICGFFGVESRNPLLDVNVVQAWLNTTSDLKNSGYKSWMVKYMEQEKYPYTLRKIHWAHNLPEVPPTNWKRDQWSAKGIH
jgi:asparagine synthetase B (glutamine-hydrolysing)